MITRTAFVPVLISFWYCSLAQLPEKLPSAVEESKHTTEMLEPSGHQGHVCGVTHENSKPYLNEISMKIRTLAEARPEILDMVSGNRSSTTVSLQWPLKQAKETSNFTYYVTTNYVDLDPDTFLLDYHCGERVYDGHNGLDISLYPYSWKMMEDEVVSVVAAADGIIVAGHDGAFDENCELDSLAGWGNWLALMHVDGTVTVYVHFKQNTVIPIIIGAAVSSGDFLGFVGSSGNSTGPHLHFGVYINNLFNADGSLNATGDLVEPYSGSCHNVSSLWAQQKPYDEPSVVAIETHSSLPEIYYFDCDMAIDLYFTHAFEISDWVYYRTWIRDFVSGNATVLIVNPFGIVNSSTVYAANDDRNRRFDGEFPLIGATAGTYTIRVLFDGKTWERYFTVGCQENYALSGNVTTPKGYIAGNQISTSQVIENTTNMKVEYHADGSVVFTPGFHAKPGAKIVADHKGCAGGYYY